MEPGLAIPFATTSLRTTIHFFVGRSFPHFRRPQVYPPPFYLPTLFPWILGFLYPLISSPCLILVLRFEIYDDARTRALASSDYVYDLIEGSGLGRKVFLHTYI